MKLPHLKKRVFFLYPPSTFSGEKMVFNLLVLFRPNTTPHHNFLSQKQITKYCFAVYLQVLRQPIRQYRNNQNKAIKKGQNLPLTTIYQLNQRLCVLACFLGGQAQSVLCLCTPCFAFV